MKEVFCCGFYAIIVFRVSVLLCVLFCLLCVLSAVFGALVLRCRLSVLGLCCCVELLRTRKVM